MIVFPSGEVGLHVAPDFVAEGEEWFESKSDEDEKMSVGVEGKGGDPGMVDCWLVWPTSKKVSTILPIPLTAARQLIGESFEGLLRR